MVIICFAYKTANAQIQALSGSTLTSNMYTTATISGFGNNSVVLFKKTGINNDYVLASYAVSSTGAVTLNDTESFTSQNTPAIVKLTATRMALVKSLAAATVSYIYDLDGNGDFITKGSAVHNGLVSLPAYSVIRLTNTSYAVAFKINDKLRLESVFVNSTGTALTIKDIDEFTLGNILNITLAQMSNTRIVAAFRLDNNSMRVTCYDVNEANGAISRNSTYQLAGSMQRITMSGFSSNKLACFTNDMNNNLDVTTLEISTIGTFTLKNQYQDLKMPGSANNYQLANMDCQYDSSTNKIHLFATRITDKLNIIPFNSTSTGAVTQNATGHYLSSASYISTSVSAASSLMVAASRQLDGKARIQAFKWN